MPSFGQNVKYEAVCILAWMIFTSAYQTKQMKVLIYVDHFYLTILKKVYILSIV